MTWAKDKKGFLETMVKEGMHINAALSLLKHAQKAQNFAVKYCNKKVTHEEEQKDVKNCQAIADIATRYGMSANPYGDPRGGTVVHIYIPTNENHPHFSMEIAVPCRYHP